MTLNIKIVPSGRQNMVNLTVAVKIVSNRRINFENQNKTIEHRKIPFDD